MREDTLSVGDDEIGYQITPEGLAFMEEWHKCYIPWSAPLNKLLRDNGMGCRSQLIIMNMLKFMELHDFEFIPCPQWAIGQNTGSSRATVNRLFRELKRRGWILQKGHSWKIEKDGELYTAAQQGWVE